MSPEATCASALSYLPNLEPLAGAALALNLAYLSLDPFRYRNQIRANAEKTLDELKASSKQNQDIPKGSLQCKRVMRLAGHEDENKTKLKDGMYAFFFTAIYGRIADRHVGYFCVAISIMCLCLGVLHSSKQISFVNCWFDAENISWYTWSMVLILIFPIIMVWLGRRVVAWADEFSKEEIQNLAEVLQQSAVAQAQSAAVAAVSPPNPQHL